MAIGAAGDINKVDNTKLSDPVASQTRPIPSDVDTLTAKELVEKLTDGKITINQAPAGPTEARVESEFAKAKRATETNFKASDTVQPSAQEVSNGTIFPKAQAAAEKRDQKAAQETPGNTFSIPKPTNGIVAPHHADAINAVQQQRDAEKEQALDGHLNKLVELQAMSHIASTSSLERADRDSRSPQFKAAIAETHLDLEDKIRNGSERDGIKGWSQLTAEYGPDKVNAALKRVDYQGKLDGLTQDPQFVDYTYRETSRLGPIAFVENALHNAGQLFKEAGQAVQNMWNALTGNVIAGKEAVSNWVNQGVENIKASPTGQVLNTDVRDLAAMATLRAQQKLHETGEKITDKVAQVQANMAEARIQRQDAREDRAADRIVNNMSDSALEKIAARLQKLGVEHSEGSGPAADGVKSRPANQLGG